MNGDPHTWQDWIMHLKAWLHGDIPLDSLLMTAAVAALRCFIRGKAGDVCFWKYRCVVFWQWRHSPSSSPYLPPGCLKTGAWVLVRLSGLSALSISGRSAFS